jgi:hypothetical protein
VQDRLEQRSLGASARNVPSFYEVSPGCRWRGRGVAPSFSEMPNLYDLSLRIEALMLCCTATQSSMTCVRWVGHGT